MVSPALQALNQTSFMERIRKVDSDYYDAVLYRIKVRCLDFIQKFFPPARRWHAHKYRDSKQNTENQKTHISWLHRLIQAGVNSPFPAFLEYCLLAAVIPMLSLLATAIKDVGNFFIIVLFSLILLRLLSAQQNVDYPAWLTPQQSTLKLKTYVSTLQILSWAILLSVPYFIASFIERLLQL